jgi:hypothetical protein
MAFLDSLEKGVIMVSKKMFGLIEPSYCLLDDYINDSFKAEKFIFDGNKYWLNQDNGIEYTDVDIDSIRLYCYWKNFIENKTFPTGKVGRVTIKDEARSDGKRQRILNVNIGDRDIELSADYIGPLKGGYRKKYGIERLGTLLKETRTFAGNMIWPYRKIGNYATVNQYKGLYLYERLDIVLLELKKYYLNEKCDRKVLNVDFCNYKEWYNDCFGQFDSFIEYFYLQDFVDSFLLGENILSYKEYLGLIETVLKKRENRMWNN